MELLSKTGIVYAQGVTELGEGSTMSLDGVPAFPEFQPVVLEDKPCIDRVFSEFPTKISERTFSSMFIWRKYGPRSGLSQLDVDLLVSWFRAQFGRLVLPPVGATPSESLWDLIMRKPRESAGIAGAFGTVEPVVSEIRAKGVDIVPLGDEWDYVYRTEDLIKLEGTRYHTAERNEERQVCAPVGLCAHVGRPSAGVPRTRADPVQPETLHARSLVNG